MTECIHNVVGTLVLSILPGAELEAVFDKAQNIACQLGYPDVDVHFHFNGVTCNVTMRSNKDVFVRQYNRLFNAKATGIEEETV